MKSKIHVIKQHDRCFWEENGKFHKYDDVKKNETMIVSGKEAEYLDQMNRKWKELFGNLKNQLKKQKYEIE